MFGMTPMTAWELEADRRRELARHREEPRQSLLSDRRDGPEAADRRLFHGWRALTLNGWDDTRP